jgi:phosphoribosylamine---glycine ligase
VEFNARFGDPETQVVLDRLATPLGGLLRAAAVGDLARAGRPDWRAGAAVTVVIAAEGYPVQSASGDEITGLAEAARQPGVYVLQAGTSKRSDGALVSGGGRVLNVVAEGDDIPAARGAAYAAAAMIKMRGGWYRTDIAANAATGES